MPINDIQAYLYCPASNATAAVLAINKTLDVLETWMSTNRLRLNPSKTQFIWFGPRQQLAKLYLSAIAAADFPHFIFSPVVRDLGVTLDQELTFAPHIHCLCRDSYYQLRQLTVYLETNKLLPECQSGFLLFALLPQSLPLHLSMPSLQPD